MLTNIKNIWICFVSAAAKRGSVVSLLKADKANMRQNTAAAPSQNNKSQDDFVSIVSTSSSARTKPV